MLVNFCFIFFPICEPVPQVTRLFSCFGVYSYKMKNLPSILWLIVINEGTANLVTTHLFRLCKEWLKWTNIQRTKNLWFCPKEHLIIQFWISLKIVNENIEFNLILKPYNRSISPHTHWLTLRNQFLRKIKFYQFWIRSWK